MIEGYCQLLAERINLIEQDKLVAISMYIIIYYHIAFMNFSSSCLGFERWVFDCVESVLKN